MSVESSQESAKPGPRRGSGVSLRAAINAFCRSCLYDPHEPGRWREQIEACTATDCPLYPVRPRSRASKPLEAHAQAAA